MDLEIISNSRRGCWRDCRYKYRCRYVDMFEPFGERDNSALVFGSYIHRILELGINSRSLNELRKIAVDELENYGIHKKYRNKVDVCLKNFFSFNKKLNFMGTAEKSYEVKINEDFTQHGIIDRLVELPGNGLLIVDYKTSKREKTPAQLYEDTQGMDYTYACHILYKVPLDKITFAHFYPVTGNFSSVKYKPAAILENVRNTVGDVKKIREAKYDDLQPNQNEFCDWCDYKDGCPVHNPQHVVDKVISEAKIRKR